MTGPLEAAIKEIEKKIIPNKLFFIVITE